MEMRIVLDEGGPPAVPTLRRRGRRPRRPQRALTAVVHDEKSREQRPLLLYLADEPAVGTRFRYQDLDWEVVEYRDGWLARLVVDEA